MIKETRLVAAFVGRLWYRLTLDCTWMFLFLFLFFNFIFFWEGEGVNFANHGLTETHFPSVVCVWRKSFWRSLFFGTKDSLKKKSNKKKTKQKHTCSVKALFFLFLSETWAGWGRHNTEMSCVEIFFCLFKLDKVSFCQVQRPFQNKTCYCEATLIKKKRYKNWRQKKPNHFLSSGSCPRVQVDTMLQQTAPLLCRFWGFFFTKFGLW